MAIVITYIVCVAILIVAGIREKKIIADSVAKIDLRINVNGIRGKSTATRFITSILEAAGYRVIGKTTGTSARMIFWGQKKELAIKRRPVGPNIGEQVKVLKQAADMGANALVCECMAVNPEYQKVYQHDIIKANITVITNVVEDHLDLMGPTTDQISWAFAETIPYNGILVCTEGPYSDYFRQRAAERGSKVICIDPELIAEKYIGRFPYMIFKNNAALGIGVARALGIDDQLALRAMLNAHPDPGSTQIVPVSGPGGRRGRLINAFAANEPESSLEIWEQFCERNGTFDNSVLILCCRDDRIDRTRQFVDDFMPYVSFHTLIVIGTGTLEVLHAFRENMFPNIDNCIDLTNEDHHEIIATCEDLMDDTVYFCAGNIHGVAEEFLDEFADIQI